MGMESFGGPQKPNRYEVLAEVEQLESEHAGLLTELEAQRHNLEILNQKGQDLQYGLDAIGLGPLTEEVTEEEKENSRKRTEFELNSNKATILQTNEKIERLTQREREIMEKLDANNKLLEAR